MRLLAAMGGNPMSVRYSGEAYASAVASPEVDAAQRSALLARDASALSQSLGGQSEMRCLIMTAD